MSGDGVLRAGMGELSIEAPWDVPAGTGRVKLVRATDGGMPRLATTVAVYRDETSLVVLFSGEDDETAAHYLVHGDPLWEEDVVEVFLAPVSITEYFEIEVNPLGTTFHARITSPDGHRATMRTDAAWKCRGLYAFVRKDFAGHGRFTLSIVVKIPFASLGAGTPGAGDAWRANFYRIDRSLSRGDELTAWRPTRKSPPDFHVPAAFGTLLF